MTTAPLTVGDLLARPPLMPLWPDFGRDVCQLSRASVYRLAALDQLPVPVVCMGTSPTGNRGRRFVRTADVVQWLHLHLPDTNEAAAVAPATASNERTAPSKDGARS